MPRYFFHRKDGGFQPDRVGTECDDVPSARLHAILFAAATLKEKPELVWAGGEMRITVSDAKNILVTTIIVLAVDTSF